MDKYRGNFYFSFILVHSLCREWNDEGMMINSSIRRYTFEYRSKVSLIYGGEGGSLFGPFVTQMTIFGTVYFNVAVVFRARVECGREIDPRDIPFFYYQICLIVGIVGTRDTRFRHLSRS